MTAEVPRRALRNEHEGRSFKARVTVSFSDLTGALVKRTIAVRLS